MILKSCERKNASRLADHLMNVEMNERVTVLASRDLVRGDNVHRALAEMTAIGKGTRCEFHLHHVSMNPSEELTPEQWDQAWATYEQEFGLIEQPFIEVEHHKEGRTHRHRVYDRVTEQLKAVDFSHSWKRNELVGRQLEHEFGHQMTLGKHNQYVMGRLREDGLGHMADWMEQEKAHQQVRPVAGKSHADHQIEQRTGLSKAEAEQTIRQCWDRSDSGHSLKVALEEDGLLLARGDRRDFVVLDQSGATHSLGRRVGEKAKVVKQRMADLSPDNLPGVEQAREMQLELAIQQARAVAEREREAAKQAEMDQPAPDMEQGLQEPSQPDQAASDKRKRKKQVEERLDQAAAKLDEQEKQQEAEKRRKLALERRKQREEQRRLAAERAEALKAELEDREQQGLLGRVRHSVSQQLGRVAGWMRGLVRFGKSGDHKQAQTKEAEARKEVGADAEITQKSEQQRQPDRTSERQKSRRQIIDLEAITREREARERKEGRSKDKDKSQEQQQDQGIGLERRRDDPGDRGGGDDDPFSW